MKRWGIHIDHPWSKCVQQDGAPKRIYLRTPFGLWVLGEPSMVYDRKNAQYLDKWAHLVYRPNQDRFKRT